jgi:hypothetical protein
VRRVKLVAFSCLVGLFTLALCDLAARMAVNDSVYMTALTTTPSLFRYNAGGASDRTIAGDLGSVTADARDDDPRRVVTTIDELGFRNAPATASAPIDLVLLGDSFAFGFGTTQDQTLAPRLQVRTGLAAYNMAMPWTGPWGQYLNLAVEAERLSLRKGGTVVWLLFSGNDLDDVYGDLDLQRLPRNGAAGRFVVALKRFRNRSPIYRRLRDVTARAAGATPDGPVTVVMPATFVNGRAMLFLKPYAEVRERSYDRVVSHPNYAPLRQTLAAGADLASRLDVTLRIALAPSKEEVYAWVLDGTEPWSTSGSPSGFGKAVSELCAELKIDFLDLKPVFVETSKMLFERSGETLWWYDDSHWNAHGHDLAAAAIHRQWFDAAAGHDGRQP